MRTSFTVKVRGRLTAVRVVNRMPKGHSGDKGLAQLVGADKANVWLNGKMGRDDLVETLLHELLHVALWDLDEEAVDSTAEAQADALRELLSRLE